MNDPQRERLGLLLERALALPTSERARFIEEASGEDRVLREELTSLLAASEPSSHYFDALAGQIGAALAASADFAGQGAPRERHPVEVGDVVSHYEILECIGGGMGVVYRAHDLRLDRPVALKFLPRALAADERARERLYAEARAASALDHPNIGAVYEIDEADPGGLYIALAWCDGETLKEKLRRGRMPVAEGIGIAREVASALAAAHTAGIIHRDVKPSNIIVTPAGGVKLLDFGIAKIAGTEPTREGWTPGTVAYMSPEQTRGEPVDARTDVWSLGVVLYEMLAGRRPFSADHDATLIHAIRHDGPETLTSLRSDLPAELVSIVERCLAKEPSARYTRAGDLLADLDAMEDASATGRRGGLRGTAPGLHESAENRTPMQAAQGREADGDTPGNVGLDASPQDPPHRGWPPRSNRARAVVGGVILLLLSSGAAGAYGLLSQRGETLQPLVGELEQALAAGEWIEAFRLAEILSATLPDSTGERLRAAATVVDTLSSEPAGAAAFWRPFDEPDADWLYLGTTPVEARLPRALVAVKLELEGYVSRFGFAPGGGFAWPLRRVDDVDPDALFVPGGEAGLRVATLRHTPSVTISDYLIDRYEVTNRQFQRFVTEGGYENRDLWEHPFVNAEGLELTWEEAMALFVDRTGQPGPATWEVGTFPAGTAEHPVTGLSWYEAQAYAAFVGRQLPTLFHWYRAAGVENASLVIPWSNFAGEGLAPVGEFPGLTLAGAYDMAGNAREWLANATGNLRYTVGGGWNDPDYAFIFPQPQPPFDRSGTNGLRLMTDLGTPEIFAHAAESVDRYPRDFSAERPASDETFEVLKSVYDYDRTPLNVTVEAVDTVEFGIRERITFDAAYGQERMVLYLFYPKESRAPLQTIVIFPGNGALRSADIVDWTGPRSHTAFLVQSGRAVAFPIYKATFERRDGLDYHMSRQSSVWRQYVVQWRQDLARSLDYLDTRPEIDPNGFGYFGYSWGGWMGPILLALEPRLQAAILYVSGFPLDPPQPAVDPFNFASRVRTPVLMINARHDYIFPLEISARPLFEHLGSREKEHYLSEGGHSLSTGSHFVPRTEVIRETLRWFDRHLGPAR